MILDENHCNLNEITVSVIVSVEIVTRFDMHNYDIVKSKKECIWAKKKSYFWKENNELPSSLAPWKEKNELPSFLALWVWKEKNELPSSLAL